MTRVYDLAIAWDWEYDHYFVSLIEQILQAHGLKTYRVEYHNVEETLHNIKKNLIRFNYFFDRTADEVFLPLVKYLEKSSVRIFNPRSLTKKSNDKATMHLEFMTAGINVPYTIIISPYNSKREVEFSLSELAHLGRPFIIKPANNTGGGMGVVTGAEYLKDIIETRQHQKDDKYLVQEKINPRQFDSKRGWFRCFFAFGKVFITWWDDLTHRYETVTESQEIAFKFDKIKKIMNVIHKVCMLDFFSSEIAITDKDKIVVVDYVNDVCDMRPQSSCYDGVPDSLVSEIIYRLAVFIKHKRD
jgi:hypothetical protein